MISILIECPNKYCLIIITLAMVWWCAQWSAYGHWQLTQIKSMWLTARFVVKLHRLIGGKRYNPIQTRRSEWFHVEYVKEI